MTAQLSRKSIKGFKENLLMPKKTIGLHGAGNALKYILPSCSSLDWQGANHTRTLASMVLPLDRPKKRK